MAIIERPYELLIRFNVDGTIGSHYKSAWFNEDEKKDVGVSQPQTIAGLKAKPELLAEVNKIVSLELASKTEVLTKEVRDMASKVEKTEARMAQAEEGKASAEGARAQLEREAKQAMTKVANAYQEQHAKLAEVTSSLTRANSQCDIMQGEIDRLKAELAAAKSTPKQ